MLWSRSFPAHRFHFLHRIASANVWETGFLFPDRFRADTEQNFENWTLCGVDFRVKIRFSGLLQACWRFADAVGLLKQESWLSAASRSRILFGVGCALGSIPISGFDFCESDHLRNRLVRFFRSHLIRESALCGVHSRKDNRVFSYDLRIALAAPLSCTLVSFPT